MRRDSDLQDLLGGDVASDASDTPLNSRARAEEENLLQEQEKQLSPLVSHSILFLPPLFLLFLVIFSLATHHSSSSPLLDDPLVCFGLLVLVLFSVMYTSAHRAKPLQYFYKVVPSLLLCYFIPGVLNTTGVISGEQLSSSLYKAAKLYLLPPCLLLLTLSIDVGGVARLGPKAVLMFLAGTLGVVFGGPLSVAVVGKISPSTVGGEGNDAVWRGLACVAGSWIGGSANQVAMLEIFQASPEVFSLVVAVDVIIANIWMGVLLFLASRSESVDRFLRADAASLDRLRKIMDHHKTVVDRIPSTQDLLQIISISYIFTGISQQLAVSISSSLAKSNPDLKRFSLTDPFFWLLMFVTGFGIALSFTRARQLERVGASKVASVMLYLLVMTIGMQMDISYIAKNPGLLGVGILWIIIHAIVLFAAAYILRAPLFFLAVGSQANIGGAASAPVVAAVFHPALAPVGVLLAICGYILGTYGAYLSGVMMELAAPSS